jgi:hypothetical protein
MAGEVSAAEVLSVTLLGITISSWEDRERGRDGDETALLRIFGSTNWS